MDHPDLDEPSPIDQLFTKLLQLEAAPALGPALAEILRLLAEVTPCELVYLELFGDDGFWRGHATFASAGGVRARVKRELIAQTLAARTTIIATLPRVEQRWREATVLCTPIGTEMTIGVIYAETTNPLGAVARQRFEAAAFHLASLRSVNLRKEPSTLAEELRFVKQRRIREAMARFGSISAAARGLRVSRSLVYRTLRTVAARDERNADLARGETDASNLSSYATQIGARPVARHQEGLAVNERP